MEAAATTARDTRTRVYPASRGLVCFACGRPAQAGDPRGRVIYRGRTVEICSQCRGGHALIKEQVAAFGRRFRFVRKSEVPQPVDFGYRVFRQLYMILLIADERRGKEVNSMAIEEKTKRHLRLPDAIARVIAQTFVVCGDDAKLSDDVALQQIRDLVEEIDPEIFARIRNRPKRKRKK
jgi:hypothetical protein